MKRPEQGEAVSTVHPTGTGNGDPSPATAPIAIPPQQSVTQETHMTSDEKAPPSGTQDSIAFMEPSRGSGSISSIELQVQSEGESQVGLRFIERQGRVEVQMKPTSQQTAQVLIGSVDELKNSLAREGWIVEIGIPTHLTLAVGAKPEPAAFNATFTSTNPPPAPSLPPLTGLQDSSPVAEIFIHRPEEPTDTIQSIRTEAPATAPLNQNSNAESSTCQNRSQQEKDGSSDRREQQQSSQDGNTDSERQDRPPARIAGAWLDSIESLLSQPTTLRFPTGA
jgi:hypothetical protein